MAKSSSILHINEVTEQSYGGKADGLRKLSALGLRIPDTYIVPHGWTTHADGDRHLQDFIEKAGHGPFAVRSSGIGEDGQFASAAGQFQTFLDVRGREPLAKAIRDCFRSSDAENLRSYREATGSTDGEAMSVIIQTMVKARTAGVIFTVDPVSGDRAQLIVEAVPGVGDSLVGGQSYSGQYRISRNTQAILSKPEGLRGDLLNREQIDALVSGALEAEHSWSMPLDLEWAIDGNGKLFWLQARPITTLNEDSLDTPLENERELLTRANIGEMFPGAATPLTLSVFGECLDWGLWKMYRKMGALKRNERPRFIFHFQNQFFLSLTATYYSARRIAGATRENTEMNILGRILPEHDIGQPSSKIARAFNSLKYINLTLGHKRYLRKINRKALRFRVALENVSAEELYDTLIRCQKSLLNRVFFYHYAVSAFSGVMNSVLASILSGEADITDEGQSLMSELLADIDGIESANVVESLDALADTIVASGHSRWFLEADNEEALSWLIDEKESEPASGMFSNFLRRHGHRSIREAELREKDWATFPEELIATLRGLVGMRLRRTEGDEAHGKGAAGASPSAPTEASPKPPKMVLSLAKKGVRDRELSKARFILAEHQFKLGYRKLGNLLRERNFIPDADLIYFLTKEEIGELFEGAAERLTTLAMRRRRRYPQQMKIQFPELSHGRPTATIAQSREASSSYRGTPVSRGVAEGKVRIVTSVDDARKLKPGEIMVASFTDIGWTPYYGIVGGLITELGGALSHGAVVAREYGLPLVSNIPDITSLLSDGQLIRMDGRDGSVAVLRDSTMS